MNAVYIAPSLYAHVLNGLLFLVAIIYLYLNYSQVKKLSSYKVIIMMLIFSIAIGVHGLLHLGLESIYGYNPINVLLK